MIGKITVGKSFGGCIAYCLNDKIKEQNQEVVKDRAEVLLYNKCFGNEQELVQQFNDVRLLNPKTIYSITTYPLYSIKRLTTQLYQMDLPGL